MIMHEHKSKDYEIELTMMISDEDLKRYDRQIRLFGVEGQKKLKKSKVFIAGAGGLGSPISIYLTAAGVGKIVVVDQDVVELSNLNRQILHWERDIGKKKALSAQEKLIEMNSSLIIETISDTLDENNASRLVGDADLIIDALDNFPARYLLNKIAIENKIPFIHGAINGFHGQAITVLPGETACLRCIFRKPPTTSTFPVIGVTPGIIGLIQATEAIKYLTGVGELLSNKLLLWDGLKPSLDIIDMARDPMCMDCGGLV
ncbi:MAG: HesA/MoeB/ThiF family protein [Methanotrichaceae archaeon]|nr:HesA/MoeB/ThiF family protein [Methanotrichaceae archaeon]